MINDILPAPQHTAILKPLKRKEVITMPRTKGSKNRPKTTHTDYAPQIAEKQESIISLTV